MKLMNVIYVSDMKRSVAFYEALEFERTGGDEPDDHWNEFPVGDATIALHIKDPLPPFSGRLDVMLSLPADGSLERLFGIARERGSIGGKIRDEAFGRVFWVRDPDGTEITFLEIA